VNVLAFVDDDALAKATCAGTETVNGVVARKCVGSLSDYKLADLQVTLDEFLNAKGAVRAADLTKFSVQYWIAQQGGHPVRVMQEFAGKDTKGSAFTIRMEVNLTDINKAIDIAAPR